MRGDRAADQRFCFRYIDYTIPLHPLSKISSITILCGFVSDLVGNPEDRFSRDAANY